MHAKRFLYTLNNHMKNSSLGKNLLNLYGVFLILAFVFTGFDFWGAIILGSYPLLALLKSSSESIIYIAINFGLYGMSILAILIQGLVLYYGGNILEKFLKR